MKKTIILVIGFFVFLSIQAQEKVIVKEGVSFWYVCQEFRGSHSTIPQKVGIFFQEIRKQNLQKKIIGELIGIFYDAPLLIKGRRPVWGLGFKIPKNTIVKAPLIRRYYNYENVATITHRGPYSTVANTFNIIIKYIEENNYDMVGPPVDIWLGDPNRDKPEDLKTEIIIPVAKKKM